MKHEVSRYRTMIEWGLSVTALTIVVVVMLAVDSPVRQYAGSFTSTMASHSGGVGVPEPIARAGRTAWRICMDHGPLAGFAAVATVLVLFMRRMR